MSEARAKEASTLSTEQQAELDQVLELVAALHTEGTAEQRKKLGQRLYRQGLSRWGEEGEKLGQELARSFPQNDVRWLVDDPTCTSSFSYSMLLHDGERYGHLSLMGQIDTCVRIGEPVHHMWLNASFLGPYVEVGFCRDDYEPQVPQIVRRSSSRPFDETHDEYFKRIRAFCASNDLTILSPETLRHRIPGIALEEAQMGEVRVHNVLFQDSDLEDSPAFDNE